MTTTVVPSIRDAVREKYPLSRALNHAGIEAKGTAVRCPQPERHAHGDEHPSAVLHPDCIYCNACKKRFDAISLCMLSWGCSFPEALRRMGEEIGLSDGRPKVVATYDYQHRDGTIAFVVERLEPGLDGKKKTFRQRRPIADGWSFARKAGLYRCTGNHKWKRLPDKTPKIDGDLDLAEAQPVLFKLPEIIAAPAGAWILVVEGEKDVLNLVRLGFVATCNPEGAGKWRPHFAEELRGRRVCVIPDNDTPGREHAADIARSLRGVAADVRILELPDAGEKDDVSDWIARGGTAEALSALVESAPLAAAVDLDPPEAPPEREREDAADPRPTVESKNGEAHEDVDAMLGALREMPDVYQRAEKLVTVVGGENDIGGVQRELDSQVIADLPLSGLWLRLSKRLRFMAWSTKANELVRIDPPPGAVRACHELRAWPGIRRLYGITAVPVLRPDGSVLETPGYDRVTRLLFAPMGLVHPTPARPSLDDARKAAVELRDIIHDFPMVLDEHDSVWLSGLLSIVGRPAIDGPIPGILIDASSAGSGKSLLADGISIISSGRTMPRSPWTPKDEETRKRLLSLLMAGDDCFLIDNIPNGGTVASPVLDAFLTATTWRDRILGTNEQPLLPVRTATFITGNNIALGGDSPRRFLRCRIDPQCVKPEERGGFLHYPLLPWLRQERPRLLAAALTVLKAYILAGCPSQGLRALGSFEAWSGLVRSAIVRCGLPDPVEAIIAKDQDADSDYGPHVRLIRAWAQFGAVGSSAAAAIRGLHPDSELGQALSEFVRTKDGKFPDGKAIGYRFRAIDGKWRALPPSEDGQGPREGCLRRLGIDRDGVVLWGATLR